MLRIPESIRDFKLTIEAQGSKAFFKTTSLNEWNFNNYLELTHEQSSKTTLKDIKNIYKDFHDNLTWLQEQNLPKEIKRYIGRLAKDQQVHNIFFF